ncbi:MAG: lipid-A-disaccharide synthase [Chlamydiae bacterium]|nr:lipid-A-disaccharide synthase [Chlamydiota bacterium]MBI3277541.1 lipid-A-disaccharide synthase [Chlamydiota bacterium]
MKIMIIAGEPSGDQIGALLAQALRKENPHLKLEGLGGEMMKEAGVQILEDITKWAVVGLFEVFKNYWNFKKVFRLICERLDEERPQGVVLIDFPGFNLRLAKVIRQKGIRVIYYVSPQIWAWGKRRIKTILNTVHRMLVILPFEEAFYKASGVSVNFVGHPLVDFYETYRNKLDLKKDLNLAGRDPIIAILPGSRVNEIEKHWETLSKATDRVREKHPNAHFVIPCATRPIYETLSKKLEQHLFIHLYQNGMKECLVASRLAWVCSGTATLETAFLGVPMIVFYKIFGLTAFLIRRLIRVPFVGLVNLVADKKIVPELLQQDFNPEMLSKTTEEFLSHPALLDQIIIEEGHVRDRLGPPGASKRAALMILEEVSAA